MTPDEPRRRTWGTWWGVLVAAVVATLAVTSAAPSAPEDPRAGSTGPMTGDRADRARTTLAALEGAWDARDRAAFGIAAGPSARSQVWAEDAFDALVSLDVDEIRMRYVAGWPAPDAGRGAPGEFGADVAVTWSPGSRPDPDYRTSEATVSMRMADSGTNVAVLGVNPEVVSPAMPTRPPDAAPLPLWLAGELVESGNPNARCLGIGTDPQEVACARLAQVARQALSIVLPADLRTRAGLLIVLPATVGQAAALVGRDPAALYRVAGVSSTVDGSGAPGAPPVVVLNPQRFVPLDGGDRQFVVTHEAVHVATGAAGVVMPVWVAEGFADYVARRTSPVPPAWEAEQTLAASRRVGAPRSLPRDGDFASTRVHVGAAYQEAWLAFRLLGERYGEQSVVAFYTAVLDGARVGAALEDAVGVDRAELTATWRDELVRRAG